MNHHTIPPGTPTGVVGAAEVWAHGGRVVVIDLACQGGGTRYSTTSIVNRISMTTIAEVLRQVEDLKTYPQYCNVSEGLAIDRVQQKLVDMSEYTNGYTQGAQAALHAVESYLRSRIEHDRGRG